MKTLDDILFGFLIFFAIDRMVRLFSNGMVEPWAEKRSKNRNVVENWKLAAEFGALMAAILLVYNNRRILSRLNTS
jgi:hypothetical protein